MRGDITVCGFHQRSNRQLGALCWVVVVLTPRQGAVFPRVAQGNTGESQAIEHRYGHQNDQHKADDQLLSFRQLQVEMLSFHVSLWQRVVHALLRHRLPRHGGGGPGLGVKVGVGVGVSLGVGVWLGVGLDVQVGVPVVVLEGVGVSVVVEV